MTTIPEIRWRKSTFSPESGDCVEMANTLDALRDSKHPTGPILPVAGLRSLIAYVQDGRRG